MRVGMIALVLALTFSAKICDGGNKPKPRPTPTQTPTPKPTIIPTPKPPIPIPTFTPLPTPTPFPLACNDPLAEDVTPKIVAANFVHKGGGCFKTPLIPPENQMLSLHGVYDSKTTRAPIQLKSGSKLKGVPNETIIIGSDVGNVFTIIAAFKSYNRNGDSDTNITIEDVLVTDKRKDYNSVQQAISLGNIDTALVQRVMFYYTNAIGLQAGGSAQFGKFAKNVKFLNNTFIGTASQVIACVNCDGVDISYNKILKPSRYGGPGSSSIDIEPNAANDRSLNIRITNNLIDHRNAENDTTGNGILVQAPETPLTDNILIDSNILIGGNNNPQAGIITNKMSNGIYCWGLHMKNVTITNNKITRTGQSGIYLNGDKLTVEGNSFVDVGGGGTVGTLLTTFTNSLFKNNSFKSTGIGPANGEIILIGSFAGSTIDVNPGWAKPAYFKTWQDFLNRK